MKHPVSLGLFILACSSNTALYAETDQEKPSLAFLEFLGSFETEDGQWLDPMEIEEMIKLSNKTKEIEEKNDE